jgi:hypothetical protein
MVKKPGVGWVGPIFADDAQGIGAHLADHRMETSLRARSQYTGMCRRVQSCSPENLIRHPIADTREALLHEEHSL